MTREEVIQDIVIGSIGNASCRQENTASDICRGREVLVTFVPDSEGKTIWRMCNHACF